MELKKGDKVRLILEDGVEDGVFDWYIELCKDKIIGTVLGTDRRLVTVIMPDSHKHVTQNLFSKSTLTLYKTEVELISSIQTGGI